MPRVSVIILAHKNTDLETLRCTLAHQTFQDFEIITEVGNSLSQAWRRAINRAGGDILVFIDPDSRPVSDRWLAELVSEVATEKTIVKGPEVTDSPLDPSSLAGFREAFVNHLFDESYPWAEDTEFFCRLKEAGYRFVQLDCAPVVHLSKPGSKVILRRAFRYGIYQARLKYRYADPVEIAGVSIKVKVIFRALLNLLGVAVGTLIYRPDRSISKPSNHPNPK